MDKKENESVCPSEASFVTLQGTIEENGALYGYYCQLCRAKMSSQLTWQAHLKGQRHIKAKKFASYGSERPFDEPGDNAVKQQLKIAGGARFIKRKERNEVAAIQSTFEAIHNRAIVGLDYVQEIWRKDETIEPAYHCSLCTADCQRSSIIEHVIGYRHRLLYLREINYERYKYFSKSISRKSNLSILMEEEMQIFEKINGKGISKVALEISDNEESENIKDTVSDADNLQPHQSKDDCAVDVRPKRKKHQKLLLFSKENVLNNFKKSSIQDQVKLLKQISSLNILPKLTESEQKKHMMNFSTFYTNHIVDSLPEEESIKIFENCLSGDFSWPNQIIMDLISNLSASFND